MRRAAAALVLGLAIAGCGGGDDDPLTVSAASSLKDALTACTEGGDVRLSFAGSDELAAQIRNGAKPDVYAAANMTLPLALAKEGLLSEPVLFATNELVIAVPKDSDISALEDLAEPGVKVVVGSESVPVGAYTKEVLDRVEAPVAEGIRANVRSEEPDVKGIVGKLTQGAADAGFVYRSDVTASDDLREVPLPADLEPVVEYGAGAIKGAGEDAHTFVSGLVEGNCADALGRAGFGPAP